MVRCTVSTSHQGQGRSSRRSSELGLGLALSLLIWDPGQSPALQDCHAFLVALPALTWQERVQPQRPTACL